MAKRNYVLDTSVYLTDSNSIYKFENHDIFIPLKVLEEIDKHKKRQDSVGANARHTIKILDELRSKGSIEKGVRIDKGLGILKVVQFAGPSGYSSVFPEDLNISLPDHMIIATAKSIQQEYDKKR